MAIFYSLRLADDYQQWLADGFTRPGARRSKDDFEVAATASVVITDDVAAAIDRYRPATALYVGGMGAKEKNFHAELYRRMGYGDAVDEIGSHFRSGDKAKALAAVPDEMVRETMIVGSAESVRAQIDAWEASGVTMLMVTARDVATIEALASIVGAPATAAAVPSAAP